MKSLPLSLLIVLAAFALRLHALDRVGLWNDEGNTVATVTDTLPGMIEQMLADAVHPPLFFFVEKIALVFGDSEFALRYLAVAFGAAGVAAAARLGREWAGRRVGLLCAAFLAFAPFAVWHSREARMYSLLILLNLGVLRSFERFVAGRWRRGEEIPFILLSAALYTTHYFGLFAPLIQFIYLLFTFRQTHRLLVPWLGCQLIAGLPIGLWIVAQYAYGVTLKIAWIPTPAWTDLLGTLAVFTVGGRAGWQWVVWAGMMGLALWGLRSLRRGQLLLALWSFLPMLVTFAISLRRPLYVDRYFIGSLPPLLMMIAAGVGRIISVNEWKTDKRIAAHSIRLSVFHSLTIATILAATLISAMLWQVVTLPDAHREDWRGAVRFVLAQRQSGDQLLRRSKYYWAVDYYRRVAQNEVSIPAMDEESWTATPPAALTHRLWLIYRIEERVSGSQRTMMLTDLYRQAPTLETLDWLQTIEPSLREWYEFEGVGVLLYDFDAIGDCHGASRTLKFSACYRPVTVTSARTR